MSQLAEFLSSCKALESVSLHFVSWGTVTTCPLRGIPNVQEVDFGFFQCKPAAGIEICGSIHFPEASKIALTVENLKIEENDKEWSSKHESLVRECLLRHPPYEDARLCVPPS